MFEIEETNSGSAQPINPDNFNKAVSTEDNVETSEDYQNLEGIKTRRETSCVGIREKLDRG